jgi:hypothetical protein
MNRSRLKKAAERPPEDDFSFPPPFSEQAKYLALADKFLSADRMARKNVVPINSSKHFKAAKKQKKAA